MKKALLLATIVTALGFALPQANAQNTTGAGALKYSLHTYRYYKPLQGTSSTPRAGDFVPHSYGLERCYTKQGKHLSNEEEKEGILCNDNKDGDTKANMINWPGKHDPDDFEDAISYAKVTHRRLSWKNRLRDALRIVNPFVYHESIVPASIKPHDIQYTAEEGRELEQEAPNSLDGGLSGKSKLFRLRGISSGKQY